MQHLRRRWTPIQCMAQPGHAAPKFTGPSPGNLNTWIAFVALVAFCRSGSHSGSLSTGVSGRLRARAARLIAFVASCRSHPPVEPALARENLQMLRKLFHLESRGVRRGGFDELVIEAQLRSRADELNEAGPFLLELYRFRPDVRAALQTRLRLRNALSQLVARAIQSFERHDQLGDCFRRTIPSVVARADRLEQPRPGLGLERASKLLAKLFEPRRIVGLLLARNRQAPGKLVAMPLEIVERRLDRLSFVNRVAEASLKSRDLPLKVLSVRHGKRSSLSSLLPVLLAIGNSTRSTYRRPSGGNGLTRPRHASAVVARCVTAAVARSASPRI